MLPYRTGQPLGEPAPPKAAFADLPARKVLTLNMDVPEPWLVEPVQARACMRARAPFSNLCTRRAGRGRAPAFWPARKTGCLCTSVLSSCVPAQSGTCAHARLGPAPCNSPRAACHLAPTPRMQSWARRATAACPGMSARARGASAAQAPLDLDNLHLADLGGAPALEARFELEALLLTGSCLDIGAARGDQACGRTLPYSCRGRRGAAR